MYIIGENIHIISQGVKDALAARDARFFQELAVKQVEAGAQALDLNMGPRKKDWDEVFPWIVKTVEAVVDVPLSFDTTNVDGMEAALKTVTKTQPILNSTSAEPERLERVPCWPSSTTPASSPSPWANRASPSAPTSAWALRWRRSSPAWSSSIFPSPT